MGMSEGDKDVLGKADALLKRHAAGIDTGAVPMLTDYIEDANAEKAELAREVFRRVMLQVEGRLAHDLENRLNQHLVPQVHAAVIAALADLRQELANAIGDAVSEAIAARSRK